MKNSFISRLTKVVTRFKHKDGSYKERLDTINYYDAVTSPDQKANFEATSDKTALLKNSIKEEMSAFFLDTSFTALTQIYKANSLWKRVVWTVVVIVMLVWMNIQCYWLLEKYYRYPVEVKMDLKVSTVLEFPSVTICNLNPILKTNVYENPFTPLVDYVNPDSDDSLYKETIKNLNDQECPDYSWKCPSTYECLYLAYRCNGVPGECNNSTTEDEDDCENHQCQSAFWKCPSNYKCIPLALRCNSFPGDCNSTTTEDEDDCENNICPDWLYRCGSGACIFHDWLCDQYADCDDDELNCSVTTANYSDESSSTESTSSPEPSSTALPLFTSSTFSPLTTVENVRRKREALDNHGRGPAKDKVWSPKKRLQLYSHNDFSKRLAAGIHNDTILRDKKRLREVNLGNTTRDDFMEEIYIIYHEFEMSSIPKEKHSNQIQYQQTYENNQAYRRVKRYSKTTELPRVANTPVDMDTRLQNASFKKWNALSSNGSSNFYEEKDEEYDAMMEYAYIAAKLNDSFLEQSGHLKIDMIAACKFGGYQCSPMNFTYSHSHKYGNCYTFNSKFSNGPNLTTRFPGPEDGLRLELFLDQENYVANLAPDAGARILVHKKGTMPFLEDEGISVMPGRSTSVGIRQISFSRLPPPHGSCGDSGKTTDYYATYIGTDYSKLACLKSCYQDMAIKYCGCAVPFYYVLDNATVCNMTNKDIVSCVNCLPNNQQESYEICDKLCPVPCKETRYELSISTATWPSEMYKSYLQKRLSQTNYLYRQANDSDKEFTKLQIYFQDLIYEQVEQQKAYESMNLISDFGGQLGLWLGLSAITLGEICSFLFGMGRSLSISCWWNKTKPVQDDLTPIMYIKPANLQEMFEEMCPEAAIYSHPNVATQLPRSTEV